MDHQEDSDSSLSDVELEALMMAGTREISDWAGRDPNRAALAPVSELTICNPQKRMKKQHTQRSALQTPACSNLPVLSSSSHFEGSAGGCKEEPFPSSSQMGMETGENDRQQPIRASVQPASDAEGHRMGNIAFNSPFNFSPQFLSLIRQTLREEFKCLSHQGGIRFKRPLSSSPSSSSSQSQESLREASLVTEASKWLAKAAQKGSASRKRGRSSLHQGPDPPSESNDDREKVEFLTDEEEEEIQVPEQSVRLFKTEDYQYLLSKTLLALDLKETPGEEDQTTSPDLKRRPKGKKEFFPRSNLDENVFPFPQFFERQVKAEWAKPMADRQFPDFIKKLYALPSFTNEFLQVPLVDAPVMALHSSGLLPEDGKGRIRDSLDNRADFALRKAHKATAMAIRASATASIVSRAAIVWTRKLLQLIPDNDRRLNEGVNRILKATSFMADATLDSLIFSSRAMASAVVARRALWLRPWQADDHSKAIVLAYPFQGDKLFGDALNRILVETRDKKKALPRTSRWNDQRSFGNFSFRAQHTLPRFKQEARRPNWNQSRQSFRRGNFNPGFSKQPGKSTHCPVSP